MPIHGANLVSPAFMSALCDTVRRAAIAPDRLVLHVAEALFTEHKDAAVAVCDDLRALGVHIHLDHFGAGCASLLFMRRFPITAVRLDPSCVQMIDHEAERDVLRAVIALAHTLHLPVTADGIETESHRARLADIGCDFGQGRRFPAVAPE